MLCSDFIVFFWHFHPWRFCCAPCSVFCTQCVGGCEWWSLAYLSAQDQVNYFQFISIIFPPPLWPLWSAPPTSPKPLLRILLKQNTALLSPVSVFLYRLDISTQLFDDLWHANNMFSESILSRLTTPTTLTTLPPEWGGVKYQNPAALQVYSWSAHCSINRSE